MRAALGQNARLARPGGGTIDAPPAGMRPITNALVVALGIIAGACVVTPVVRAAPPHAAAVVTFDDALGPHGTWVVVARYGRVWRPHAHVVGPAFVPYATGGHWVSTEHGWMFETDWPWGWAAFHYGRWYLDPAEGWVWVPDHVWGPAWVEWRTAGGHIGWWPLPPPGIEVVLPLYRPRWCFVEVHHFHRHDVWHWRVDDARAAGLYHEARPVPRGGPEPGWVGRERGTPVNTVKVGPPPRQPLRPPPPPGGTPPPPAVRREPPPPAAPPPAQVLPKPPPQRFERPADRRPEPPPAAPLPPAQRFERPDDRRPEPSRPWRIEPPQQKRPLPPAEPAPPPGKPQRKKPPLSS